MGVSSSDSLILGVGLCSWLVIFICFGFICCRLIQNALRARRLHVLQDEQTSHVAYLFQHRSESSDVIFENSAPVVTFENITQDQNENASNRVRTRPNREGGGRVMSVLRRIFSSLPSTNTNPLIPESMAGSNRMGARGGLPPGLLDKIAPAQRKLGGEEGVLCVICLEEIGKSSKSRMLPCGHEFHSLCIQLWLSRSTRCPSCQADFCSNVEQTESTHMT